MFFPVLGNLRPDLVSFLPSMRQYAGNWATGLWALAPGAEEKLDTTHRQGSEDAKAISSPTIYGEREAEVVMQQILGWRAMHSQGRGLNSVMIEPARR